MSKFRSVPVWRLLASCFFFFGVLFVLSRLGEAQAISQAAQIKVRHVGHTHTTHASNICSQGARSRCATLNRIATPMHNVRHDGLLRHFLTFLPQLQRQTMILIGQHFRVFYILCYFCLFCQASSHHGIKTMACPAFEHA